MSTRAADLASRPEWQRSTSARESPAWLEYVRKHRTVFGFGLAAGLLLLGLLIRDQRWIAPDRGIGYLLGVASLCCMVTLLLYPLRKRFRVLKFIGPLPKWFRNHMVLGVTAPLAALYHCNFELGSLNSRIALFSALAVASSGLIGRFIYSKIHHGLYGRKASLKELLAQVKVTIPGVGKLGALLPELRARMTQFDREVLVPPKGVVESMKLPLVLAFKCRLQYLRLSRFVRLSLSHEASHSRVVAAHADSLERSIRLHIRDHLRHVQRVASFIAYDRLFALWHKVHFPFFVLLFISVLVHVIVVHVY